MQFVRCDTQGRCFYCGECDAMGKEECNITNRRACQEGEVGYFTLPSAPRRITMDEDGTISAPPFMPTGSALDIQQGGEHYKRFEIEPVEFIIRNKIPGAEANIIKYACRHGYKNGAEDVRKLIHYGMLLLELEYGEKYEDN